MHPAHNRTVDALRRAGRLLVAGLCLTSGTANAQNPPPWVSAVTTLTTALETLDRELPNAGYAQRVAFIEPVVRQTHDLQAMARLALGRLTDELDESQRREFDQLFAELTVASYATRFRDLGPGFEIRNDAPARGGRHSVEAALTPADSGPVRLDYLLHERDGRWIIVNVLAEGVSDLALKRTQYAAIATERGFTGLREAMRDEIGALEADQARLAR